MASTSTGVSPQRDVEPSRIMGALYGDGILSLGHRLLPMVRGGAPSGSSGATAPSRHPEVP